MNFAGKVVLITGASSGIGAATALKFAKHGACLALNGRNVKNLQQVADECSAAAGGVMPTLVVGDISKEADTERVWHETIQKFGKLDVLVNNAGIIETGSIENTSLDQYDRVMNTNLRAIYHLTMLATPELIKTMAKFVHLILCEWLRSFPGVLAYNLSKMGVDQFTRCVALELAAKGVRANCVNPGVTVTNLHKRGGMDEATYQKFLEHSKNTHALGRPGTTDEVANAIVFLASDLATFSTGVSLAVDGGRHAMCPR
ncbi:3-oxoacyl-[acyl-carrier-protein] reductase FabG [Drosophila grimshawi]|uniref:GH17517 n=1 Tax=Drosophila grimshawi TaxID=7222 RepID=B4JSU1_DROGR|nr:3-oxoacyl-[acyl-carrier-protein] reductase FabG [Drosophila grimshawi]EDV94831.1 GH17517 [Drosophila grimshawi]